MYKSINRIRKLLYDHRDTHIQWVTYLTTHPYDERTAEENRVGGLMHQLKCVRDYTNAIKDLGNIEVYIWMMAILISMAMVNTLGSDFAFTIVGKHKKGTHNTYNVKKITIEF